MIKAASRRKNVMTDGKNKQAVQNGDIISGTISDGRSRIIVEGRGSTRGGSGGWAESMTGRDAAMETA